MMDSYELIMFFIRFFLTAVLWIMIGKIGFLMYFEAIKCGKIYGAECSIHDLDTAWISIICGPIILIVIMMAYIATSISKFVVKISNFLVRNLTPIQKNLKSIYDYTMLKYNSRWDK